MLELHVGRYESQRPLSGKMAPQRLMWVYYQSFGLIKAGRKSNKRRGDAEVRGGKCSFSPAGIFPSSDLRVSASPVRYFLLWLPDEIEPTRNAAELKKYLHGADRDPHRS